MSTSTVPSKATRLISEGRVRKLRKYLYAVEGDHDWYLTRTLAFYVPEYEGHLCNCPATVTWCSHALAAQHEHDKEYRVRG
jgi:hypothetical protein